MIKGKIVKLHDEDLAEISGGTFGESFVNEAGKQALIAVAAPVVVGSSVFMKWICEKITKKYDKKLENALGMSQE